MDLQKGDNGVHDIAVDEYTRVRLDFTVAKYRASARRLHGRLKLLENTGYILTGLCTALILVNEEAWVASVIVLVNITSNIAAVGMLEDRLMRINVAIVKAASLRYGMPKKMPPNCATQVGPATWTDPLLVLLFSCSLLFFSAQLMVACARGRGANQGVVHEQVCRHHGGGDHGDHGRFPASFKQ